MDRDDDPISQFFPGQEDVDLYAVLNLPPSAELADIKKSYRRLALVCHPDKHATSSEEVREDAGRKFQQVGFAYAVLSDEKRKERYDKTGRTDEGFKLRAGEDGWEAYFEEIFERVTKDKLDELKKEYQGSSEEVEDIKKAYIETDGSLEEIMSHIPHSTFEDEPRFITLITQLVRDAQLPKSKTWEKSSKDESAKLVRKKQGEKEAKEAEQLAKDLGVWDEFYGSGKPSQKKTKGKGKGSSKDAAADDEEDTSALQALILGKRKNMDGFFDSLASKYSEPEQKVKGRKGRKRANADEGEQTSGKKAKVDGSPDIDDEEFERLQHKLFGSKANHGHGILAGPGAAEPKKKNGKGRKAK